MLAMKPNVLLAAGMAATRTRVPSAVGSAVGILLMLLLYYGSRCKQEKPLRRACCKVKGLTLVLRNNNYLMTTLCVGGNSLSVRITLYSGR